MNTPPSLTLTPPNTATMNTARLQIHTHIKSLRLDFLPVMKEKLLPLQTAQTRAEQIFLDELNTALVEVKNTHLLAIDLKQQEVAASGQLSETQKEQTLALLHTQRTTTLSSLVRVLRNATRTMLQSIDDLAQISLTPRDSTLREILQRQLDLRNEKITELDAAAAAIEQDRHLLDETIKIHEQYTLAHIFKDLLPTAEDLSALSIPEPRVALLIAGINRLGRLLGKLGDALTYSELINERDKLRARYNEKLSASRTVGKEAKGLAQNLEELAGLHSLDNSKTVWTHEARKFPDSLNLFINQANNEEQPLTQQNLKQLELYIEAFHSIWRAL